MGLNDSTSSTLLTGVRAMDADAWRRFCRLYGPLVYRWARRAGLQPSDAADIVQDVFETVAAKIGQFRREPGGSFRGWMWTITRNKVHDLFRRRAAEPQAQGGDNAARYLEQLPDLPSETEESLDHDSLILRQRCLSMLREEFQENVWQAFWRVVIEKDKPRDVAEDLGVTTWAVYKAKSRVLRRLRRELDGLDA